MNTVLRDAIRQILAEADYRARVMARLRALKRQLEAAARQ